MVHWGTVSPEESCQYKLVPDGFRQGLMDLQLELSHQTTGPAKLASQDESKEKQRDLGHYYCQNHVATISITSLTDIAVELLGQLNSRR